MSTSVSAVSAAKLADSARKQDKTHDQDKVVATKFLDITQDPEFWKQATPS